MKKKISTIKWIWNIVIAIFIFSLCSCGNPLKKQDGKITVKKSYTYLTKEYGYVEIDSMTTYVSKMLDLKTDKVKEGEYTEDTSLVFTLMRSATYILFKTPLRKGGAPIIIDTLKVCYPIVPYKSLFNQCMIGCLKPEAPYVKVLNRFICFRPGGFMYSLIKGDTKLHSSIKAPLGVFKENPNHVNYPYYFLECEDTLRLLDTTNFTQIDYVAGLKVSDFCNDNLNFVFLGNSKGYYYMFDTRTRKIVTDHRSNLKSNILLDNEDITRYTGYNNEYPLEGTNLINVSFVSTEGREVYCLLNETTMLHTSDVLYDKIVPFDSATVMGILKPQNAHNIVFSGQQGDINGTIGHAYGYTSGLFSYGSFEYNGDVSLSTASSTVTKEKDNYDFGFIISKKNGKETGEVYKVFTDGQKIKIR